MSPSTLRKRLALLLLVLFVPALIGATAHVVTAHGAAARDAMSADHGDDCVLFVFYYAVSVAMVVIVAFSFGVVHSHRCSATLAIRPLTAFLRSPTGRSPPRA